MQEPSPFSIAYTLRVLSTTYADPFFMRHRYVARIYRFAELLFPNASARKNYHFEGKCHRSLQLHTYSRIEK